MIHLIFFDCPDRLTQKFVQLLIDLCHIRVFTDGKLDVFLGFKIFIHNILHNSMIEIALHVNVRFCGWLLGMILL